jgi:dephospho-CoA kinase
MPLSPKLVLISGHQGSGKTTLSKAMAERFTTLHFDVHRLKFADPIYDMASAALSALEKYGFNINHGAPDGRLLQLLGTDWGRETQGENIWCELTEKRIKKIRSHERTIIIIDDLRFLNEAEIMKDNPKLLLRLDCEEHERKRRAEKWRDDVKHISEIALDEFKDFDDVLDTGSEKPQDTLAKAMKAFSKKFKPFLE